MTATHSHLEHVAAPLLHGLAQNWWMLLLRGAVAILFGVLAFMSPGATVIALLLVWGAYALVDGMLALWTALAGKTAPGPRWWLAIAGAAGVAAGLLTFFWPAKTLLVLLMFIAAWAIVVGVMQIIGAIRLRKEIDGEWLLVLSGLVSVAFGVLMISQPAVGALAAVWLMGSYAIVIGVTYIALALRLRKHRAAA
jgi:uncharacterized membrane protein HdeD (DUF308 family)